MKQLLTEKEMQDFEAILGSGSDEVVEDLEYMFELALSEYCFDKIGRTADRTLFTMYHTMRHVKKLLVALDPFREN